MTPPAAPRPTSRVLWRRASTPGWLTVLEAIFLAGIAVERRYRVSVSDTGVTVTDAGLRDPTARPGRPRRTDRYIPWARIAAIEAAHDEAARRLLRLRLTDETWVDLSTGHLGSKAPADRAAEAHRKTELLREEWAGARDRPPSAGGPLPFDDGRCP